MAALEQFRDPRHLALRSEPANQVGVGRVETEVEDSSSGEAGQEGRVGRPC